MERKIKDNEGVFNTDSDDVENQWSIIKTAIMEAAEETVGIESRRPHKKWFDDECRAAVEKRKKAWADLLGQKTRQRIEQYKEEQKRTSKLLRKKKRESMQKKSGTNRGAIPK